MVRLATIEDLPRLVELGRIFHREANLHQVIDYCEDSTAGTIAGLIEGERGVVFVLEVGGEVIGAAAAMLAPHYFNLQHLTAQEMFWYVAPAWRGQRDALRMFDALEKWAINSGAKGIAVAAMRSSSDTVRRLYHRRGYLETETYYLGRLPCPQ